VNKYRSILKKIPGVQQLYDKLLRWNNVRKSLGSPFLKYAPAGHYLSLLPDMDDISKNAGHLFNRQVVVCPGLVIREAKQLTLLESLSSY
jgi:hypothetical protein